MSVVVCKLPKAGLGNQLFPLMHAMIFGKLNDLPVIITGYHTIKIGPWIRREKTKRQYKGYFTFEKSWLGEVSDRQKMKKLMNRLKQVTEPDVKKLPVEALKNKVFIFEESGDYQDYFRRLKDHREEVIKTLYSIIDPDLIKELNEKKAPVIGIHIRMGDFRKLKPGEKYQSGHVRPPEFLFIDLIHRIRKLNGNDLPVSIFTDGFRTELKLILSLKNIEIIEGNPDLVDLLLLSKSKLIIPTHGSTFSAWASFLSFAPIISFFDYSKPVRPQCLSNQLFEGMFDPANEMLLKKIKNLS